jgi:inosine/xanthosine triphosphate pyrophosphatase family protein
MDRDAIEIGKLITKAREERAKYIQEMLIIGRWLREIKAEVGEGWSSWFEANKDKLGFDEARAEELMRNRVDARGQKK